MRYEINTDVNHNNHCVKLIEQHAYNSYGRRLFNYFKT